MDVRRIDTRAKQIVAAATEPNRSTGADRPAGTPSRPLDSFIAGSEQPVPALTGATVAPSPVTAQAGPLSWAASEIDVSASPNRARIEPALNALKDLLIAANGAVTQQDVSDLVFAMAIPRAEDPASLEGILGTQQAMLAAKTLMETPPESRDRVRGLLAQAGEKVPVLERALLLEAMGARKAALVGADPVLAEAALKELQDFAATIRGRSPAELVAKTSVVDPNSDTEADGMKQRFNTSCVPTTFQMIRAEADPIYAWKLQEEGVATLASTGLAAEDQKRWLLEAGGEAIPREGGRGFGKGMWPEQTINEVLGPVTHLQYVRNDAKGKSGKQEMVGRVKELLERGIDVPVVALMHCLVFTDVRPSENGGSKFLLHDPWTGRATWLDEKDIVNSEAQYDSVYPGALDVLTYEPQPS